jgi:hypothetical protein
MYLVIGEIGADAIDTESQPTVAMKNYSKVWHFKSLSIIFNCDCYNIT